MQGTQFGHLSRAESLNIATNQTFGGDLSGSAATFLSATLCLTFFVQQEIYIYIYKVSSVHSRVAQMNLLQCEDGLKRTPQLTCGNFHSLLFFEFKFKYCSSYVK